MNAQYIAALERKIDAVDTCQSLSEVTAEIQESATKMLAGMASQVELLRPLLTGPSADPTEIVKWINAAIKVFAGPAAQYIAEFAATTAALASLMAKIAVKSSSMSCTFTIPGPPGIPSPPGLP